MPLVSVQMLEGRPPEVRQRLIRAIAEAVGDTLGVPDEAIRITLVELPPENWGIGATTMRELRGAAPTGDTR